jgi:microcystin-dependent protein
MSNLSQWEVAAGDNDAAPPDGAPEGMARAAVNDVMREMMAAVARFWGDLQGSLVSAGSGNAYTLTTLSQDAGADQGPFVFRADRFNPGTAATTLNLDGQGATPLVLPDGSDLYVGDIRANQLVLVAWNPQRAKYEYLNPPAEKVGTISFVGGALPSGKIAAQGQAISRSDFDVLFAAFSTTYGVGNGSTTFNVPDVGERAIVGLGASATRLTAAIAGFNGNSLGAAGGDQKAQDHTHPPDSMAVAASITNGANVVHGGTGDTVTGGSDQGKGVTSLTSSTLSLANGAVSGNTGNPNGSKHGGNTGNVQPSIVLRACIKT